MSFLIGDASVFAESGSLSEYIMDRVEDWRQTRDNAYAQDWEEYWELWQGRKDLLKRGDDETKSRAVMPAVMQAVEASVAELEEVIFGNQRWFDVEDDTFGPEDRLIADNLLNDTQAFRGPLCEMFLIGAVFGTGIAKLAVQESPFGGIALKLAPVLPLEFGVDPIASTVEEAHGVFHEMIIPRATMLMRQRAGVWAQVDPGVDQEPRLLDRIRKEGDTHFHRDGVHIIEYHGLVPREMLPEDEQPVPTESLDFEEDELVEAIVTIANSNTVMKAVANPFTRKDRGFVAYQHDTVPRRFWGRGVPEKGYWPQKVLDSETRARTDALGFSARPMIAVADNALLRSRKLEVKAGRVLNVSTGGGMKSVRDVISTLEFPGPDSGSFQQSANMERMVDMATGGFQTPNTSTGRESATGISQLNATAVRRTKRTIRNIEHQALNPLIRKAMHRFQQYNADRYPPTQVPLRVKSAMTMVARENEQRLLATLMTNLADGPAQLVMLRTIIENSSIIDRERIIQMVDVLLAQSQQQQQAEQAQPDLGGQARVMQAQLAQVKAQHEAELDVRRLMLEEQKLELDRERIIKDNQRGLIALSNDAERIEAEAGKDRAQAVKAIAEAAATEVQAQIAPIIAQMQALETAAKTAKVAAEAEATITREVVSPPKPIRPVQQTRVAPARGLESVLGPQEPEPETSVENMVLRIARDERGLVKTVNDKPVVRDSNNLITELPL